jgi:recombination protein RecA
MSSPNRRKAQRLDKTISALQGQYSERALQRGRDMPGWRPPPAIPTSFPALDALTGCGGVPLNHITLLSGRDVTSGRLTLAYKTLANAQAARAARRPFAVLLDLCRMADVDYLARCGVDLERLIVARPGSGADAVNLLVDVVRSRRARAVLVNTLPDLSPEARLLDAALATLKHILPQSNCALIFVDDPQPLWLRWLPLFDRSAIRHAAALHLELSNAQWVEHGDRLRGYRSRVEVMRSSWARSGQTAHIEILFNGTVKAGPTW